jgi:NAD(P)-dependent dehydrogenase (short-subunit alcohol dehydrogenase family)
VAALSASLPTWERLRGRHALVTGASSGIGRATAELFAAEGARVLLVGRSLERLDATAAAIAAAGGTATSAVADLTDPAAIEGLEARIDADLDGRLDVLVNCAGVYESQPFEEVSEADWQRTLRTNLRSPFLLTQLAARRMAAGGGGAIVNVSTVNALVGDADVDISAYAAAKGALHGLTRQSGVELAAANVRVNAVVPGVIDTPMLSEWTDQAGDVNDWLEARVPLGRLGGPQEVARACLFLASDDASYMNAAFLAVDGGMMAL